MSTAILKTISSVAGLSASLLRWLRTRKEKETDATIRNYQEWLRRQHEDESTENQQDILKKLESQEELMQGVGELISRYFQAQQEERDQITLALKDPNNAALCELIGYENEYRKAVVAAHNRVELFGADLGDGREEADMDLTIAYVTLTALNAPDSVGEAQEGQPPQETGFDSDQLMRFHASHGRRLVIRGEAGDGKTTLVRWAAVTAGQTHCLVDEGGLGVHTERFYSAQGVESYRELFTRHVREQQHPCMWPARIPFLLRFRDFALGKLPHHTQWHVHTAEQAPTPPDERWVESVLEDGRALVIFDGYDEIPTPAARESVRKTIRSLVQRYPDNFYILTGRPGAVRRNLFTDLGFCHVDLQPLGPRGREELIRQWHEALRQVLERHKAKYDKVIELGNALIKKFDDSPVLAGLATNPLLCAMICALHRHRGGNLPQGLNKICNDLIDMLVYRRDEESDLRKESMPPEWAALEGGQRRRVVQVLAYYLVSNHESGIDEADASPVVEDVLKRLTGDSPDTQKFIDAMVLRSGVVRRRGAGNRIEFIHNTFKEYLAAQVLVDRRSHGFLLQRFDRTDERNLLRFAATMPVSDLENGKGFADRLIERLLGAPEIRAGERDRRIFAVECEAMGAELAFQLRQQIISWREGLFPPNNMREAKSLAAIGDTAVGFLDYSPKWNATRAAAAARTLRLIGTPAARRKLEAYCRDRRLRTIREVAQVINPLKIAKVRDALTGQSEDFIPSDIRQQITDLAPLRDQTALTVLRLHGTRVSDVSPLAGMNQLKELSLAYTHVSDVSPLAGMTQLKELSLAHTQVSDVSPLAGMTRLTPLYLHNTPVSDVSPLHALIKSGLRVIGLLSVE
jgi:hypothetical protein